MNRMTRRSALRLAGSAGAALFVARNGLPGPLAALDTETASELEALKGRLRQKMEAVAANTRLVITTNGQYRIVTNISEDREL